MLAYDYNIDEESYTYEKKPDNNSDTIVLPKKFKVE